MEMETDLRLVEVEGCESDGFRFCGVETVGDSMATALADARGCSQGYGQPEKAAQSYNSCAEELVVTRKCAVVVVVVMVMVVVVVSGSGKIRTRDLHTRHQVHVR
jgi:hypothetical protein